MSYEQKCLRQKIKKSLAAILEKDKFGGEFYSKTTNYLVAPKEDVKYINFRDTTYLKTFDLVERNPPFQEALEDLQSCTGILNR